MLAEAASFSGNCSKLSRIQWLKWHSRDHCHCHECQYPETKQRKLDTFSASMNSSSDSCLRHVSLTVVDEHC